MNKVDATPKFRTKFLFWRGFQGILAVHILATVNTSPIVARLRLRCSSKKWRKKRIYSTYSKYMGATAILVANSQQQESLIPYPRSELVTLHLFPRKTATVNERLEEIELKGSQSHSNHGSKQIRME